MVLAPPIKSNLNALVACVSHCFAQEGQGHVQIGVSHPVSPFSDCWALPLFTLCCLDSTSSRKSSCGQVVLRGAFCI